MVRKILILAACCIFSVLVTACGYRFTGEGDGPLPGLRTVAIPVFENKTTEPDLGALAAGALRREFMQKGSIRVVPVEEADAVFKGTVVTVFITPAAHHPTRTTAADRITVENRIQLTMDVRCEQKGTGKILWRDPSFSYHKVYRLSGDPLNPNPLGEFETRSIALQSLTEDMAIRIHDRFLSNF